LQKQFEKEVQNRDETIKNLKEQLSNVESDLKRIKISSGMQDLAPNEQIEKYQEGFKIKKNHNRFKPNLNREKAIARRSG